MVDVALAAVDVAAVVFVMNGGGRFHRRHLLAEARRHLALVLRGRHRDRAWTRTSCVPPSPLLRGHQRAEVHTRPAVGLPPLHRPVGAVRSRTCPAPAYRCPRSGPTAAAGRTGLVVLGLFPAAWARVGSGRYPVSR
ncbi:hypothetical protein NKH18_51345 [Streptomyces sp. M10(2022)]